MGKSEMTWRWLVAGAAMCGRFSEAPMLAARVATGELPPVEERIPYDPVVQEMLSDGMAHYSALSAGKS